MNRKLYPVTLLIALSVAIAGAYAANPSPRENDALALNAAKISLTQAIAAAEQHVGGKAVKAEYERTHGRWAFDVEVVKDKKVMDVKIDPASGSVIASTEDRIDHDDEKDNDNDRKS